MASRIRFSYHRRLFIGLLAYSWMLVVCFAAFQHHREKEFKATELDMQLQMVNGAILDEIDDMDSVSIIRPPRFRQFRNLRTSIIGLDGKVIYDNSLDSLPHSDHRSRSEIADALRSGSGYSVRRHSESTGETYFYSAQRGKRYIVRSAVPYSISLGELLAPDRTFLWFMIGVTVLMCLAGYFVTRRVGDAMEEHEQREKTRLKKQLTNNINHELKTPVAAMQACLDTLTAHPDMPAGKRREFIERCNQGCTRLRNLLTDVSQITRMDDGADSIAMERVNLGRVVADICDELSLQAEEKGIDIHSSIPAYLPVNGNENLLASVFRNLIHNAISYSGGKHIVVRLAGHDKGMLTLTVTDDGVGVAPQHLPHLFERFYRVDKGRSRQAGGTGLGLAIVKNAVMLHGGSIRVDNRPCGGLAFTFTIRET